MTHYDIVIIGAGVSGLHAAAVAKMYGHSVLVLEKAPTEGGLLGTHRVGDFVYEYGGHVYSATNESIQNIMGRIGGKKIDQRQASYHFKSDRFVGRSFYDAPYPVQDYAEMIGATIETEPLFNPEVYDPRSDLLDFAEATFGVDFVKKFFGPFNRRVWTQNLQLMDTDWVTGRIKLPSEEAKGSAWGPNSSFYHAPGDEIYGDIKKRFTSVTGTTDLIYNAKILNIDPENKKIKLASHSSLLEVSYKFIISTAPLTNLLQTVSGYANRSIEANKILTRNSVMTIGISFEDGPADVISHDLRFNHWLYMDVNEPVHRISFLHRYHPKMAPSGSTSLLLEIPFRAGFTNFSNMPDFFFDIAATPSPKLKEDGWLDLNYEQKIAVFDYLKTTEIIKPDYRMDHGKAVASAIVFKGYPVPNKGVRQFVEQTKRALYQFGIYSIGRWGSHAYFNLENNFADAEAAINMIHWTEADKTRTFLTDKEANRYFWSSHYYKPYNMELSHV